MTIGWRYLPKIGSEGLMLSRNCLRADWSCVPQVAAYMRKNHIYSAWFQVTSANGWEWCHGMIHSDGQDARISQIG